MCSIMMQCSSSSIPTSKVKTSDDYVVPGFNEYAKELHIITHDLVLLHGNHSVSQELVYVIQACTNRGSNLKVY